MSNCSKCSKPIVNRGRNAKLCIPCLVERTCPPKGSWGAAVARAWPEIVAAHDGVCAFCRVPGLQLTVDHIQPRSKGGANVPENIQPLCHSCNCRKGARVRGEL